jgi:membrane protease YdiL (CAAX protease family)
MDFSPLPSEISRKTWMDRLQAAIEVLLVSGLVSGLIASVPLLVVRIKNTDLLARNANFLSGYLLLESALTFLILFALMKLHREPADSLGLRLRHWKPNFLIGLAVVPFLFLTNGVVAILFKSYLPKFYSEHNPLLESIQTLPQLALFVFSALVAGGIKEEMQRAFILNRFRTYLGGAWIGLLLWSLVFGMGHYAQGVQGIVIASLYGLLFGLLYLLSGSLVAPITAHAVYDTMAILFFWFFSGSVR